MKSAFPIVAGFSLLIAALAWVIPFFAPMAWSYGVSAIWCAVLIGAVAVHGTRGFWVLLGAPLALWHAAFAALIYVAWR